MKKKLTLIFFLASQISFAQNNPQSIPFDKFVSMPAIEWAAYASDTVNFTSADLNNLLLKRISKNEIKASKPFESRTDGAHKIIYSPLDSIDQAFYGDRIDILMDSTGTQYYLKREVPEKNSSNFKHTEVTQILYIENGKLKSYIPFITPTLPVYMSAGGYIGERFYFTTCFNDAYNSKPGKKDKLIFLTQTKKMISLKTTQKTDRLKEMYGQNLVETLWPHVLKNEIDAFSIDRNIKLKPEELDITLAYNQPVITPIYDSTGNTITSYKVIADPIETGRFTDVQLVQDWFYDHKKNKIYSYISELVLYLIKFNKKEDEEPVAVLRLVFR